MSDLQCCEVFNLWRSERLVNKYKNTRSFKVFQEDLKKLTALRSLGLNLSAANRDIANRSGLPREFLLSPKEMAKLSRLNDDDAANKLFQLTEDEKKLISQYFSPGTSLLKSDQAQHQLPLSEKRGGFFTHG